MEIKEIQKNQSRWRWVVLLVLSAILALDSIVALWRRQCWMWWHNRRPKLQVLQDMHVPRWLFSLLCFLSRLSNRLLDPTTSIWRPFRWVRHTVVIPHQYILFAYKREWSRPHPTLVCVVCAYKKKKYVSYCNCKRGNKKFKENFFNYINSNPHPEASLKGLLQISIHSSFYVIQWPRSYITFIGLQ